MGYTTFLDSLGCIGWAYPGNLQSPRSHAHADPSQFILVPKLLLSACFCKWPALFRDSFHNQPAAVSTPRIINQTTIGSLAEATIVHYAWKVAFAAVVTNLVIIQLTIIIRVMQVTWSFFLMVKILFKEREGKKKEKKRRKKTADLDRCRRHPL